MRDGLIAPVVGTTYSLLDWCVVIETMTYAGYDLVSRSQREVKYSLIGGHTLEQIDIVDLQTRQAVLHRVEDVLDNVHHRTAFAHKISPACANHPLAKASVIPCGSDPSD